MRLRRRAAGMCEISPIHLENIPSDLTGSWQQWAGFSCDRIKKLLVGGASLGPSGFIGREEICWPESDGQLPSECFLDWAFHQWAVTKVDT